MTSSSVTQREQDNSTASQAEHLATGYLLENIGRRAVSGGFVTITAQAAKFLLNFAGAAVLARLLSPREFGLVGMVLGITSLVELFKELGLSTATVQRDTITHQQVSNLFWINFFVSGLLSVISFGLAPLVARFYHDPRVAGIMMVLSLTFVLTGSSVQHQALLTRQMRFRSIAIIEVTSMLVSFASACGLAKLGFGYWALVVQQMAYATSSLLLTWISSKWRPSMPKRNSGVRPMLRFGAHLTVADFIGLLMINSDTVLVGRVFGAEPLGLYTRASVLLHRPLRQILAPINAVLTPVLSRLQSDSERYRRSFMRAYETLALITLSFAAVCLALATPLVLVVLGSKWTGVIPLFAAFAVVAVSLPLGEVAIWLFQSQGRGKEQLHNHALGGVVSLAAYIIGLHWGPMGVVVAIAITSMAVRLPIVFYFAGRSGPVSTRDLWMGFFSHLPCWGAVYLSTALAQRMLKDVPPIVQLLFCAPLGLCVGTLLFLMFRRPRESAFYVWQTMRNSFAKQFNLT